jgi:hypothetical protein
MAFPGAALTCGDAVVPNNAQGFRVFHLSDTLCALW